MLITIDPNKKVLLDADVIIHFFKGDKLSILHTIFPNNKLYILDFVFNEVLKGTLRIQFENLLRFKYLFELEFEKDPKVRAEYARLKKIFGSGESACMAYCRYNNDVLASSNLNDIKKYCTENSIQYITTMDFIYQAYITNVLTESDCDYFIFNVKSKGSKLPFNKIKDYISALKPGI